MPESNAYEAVIGLEVHVQLRTETKMFCRCPNLYGAEQNSLVCPTCLGYPGSLPVVNRQAIDLGLKLALALGAEVSSESQFARKSYFYADLPKGYQISQFDRPLAHGGSLPLTHHERVIPLERLHIEEDSGKLTHHSESGEDDAFSRVDFNRSGVPLVEVVSKPEMRTPAEAQDYLQTLHQVLRYTETSDANMEEGSLRCDANVSVRRRGETALGTKAEVKNLNSFRHVARALEFEIKRQIEVVEAGDRVAHETRTFDAARGVTRSLRSKEEAHDYRYFPEPDLPPLRLEAGRTKRLLEELPSLPWKRREELAKRWHLSPEDARQLCSSLALAAYFEAAAGVRPDQAQTVANWLKTEVLRHLKGRKLEIENAIAPERLAQVVELVESGRISGTAGKELLSVLWDEDGDPAQKAEQLGLLQIRDVGQAEDWVQQALTEHPQQAAQYRAGKEALLGFFVGQVMRLSKGRAEPAMIQQILRQRLSEEP